MKNILAFFQEKAFGIFKELRRFKKKKKIEIFQQLRRFSQKERKKKTFLFKCFVSRQT